jgi:lipopolysaccharide transport system permease protein
LGALLAYSMLKYGALPWTWMLLPALLVLQSLAMLGVAFALASISVFFRDMKDFIQVFAAAGVYIMPVFYLPDWVPALFRPLLYLNPFSYLTWCYQDALYYGRFDHPWAWLVLIAGSLLVFAAGYRTFRLLKPHVADVL